MRDHFQSAALGYGHRLFEEVSHLPGEIVTRNRKENLGCAVRVDQTIEKIFTSDVHVRVEAVKVTVFLEGVSPVGFIIRLARWDDQVAGHRSSRDDALLNRRFREDEADAGA